MFMLNKHIYYYVHVLRVCGSFRIRPSIKIKQIRARKSTVHGE